MVESSVVHSFGVSRLEEQERYPEHYPPNTIGSSYLGWESSLQLFVKRTTGRVEKAMGSTLGDEGARGRKAGGRTSTGTCTLPAVQPGRRLARVHAATLCRPAT